MINKNESELLDFCEAKSLSGVISLIHALQTRNGCRVKCIFSTTVGFAKLDRDKFQTEEEIAKAIFSLPTFQLGSKKGEFRPMNNLLMVPLIFKKMTPEGMLRFDEVCHDFVLVIEKSPNPIFKSVGSVTILNDKDLPPLS